MTDDNKPDQQPLVPAKPRAATKKPTTQAKPAKAPAKKTAAITDAPGEPATAAKATARKAPAKSAPAKSKPVAEKGPESAIPAKKPARAKPPAVENEASVTSTVVGGEPASNTEDAAHAKVAAAKKAAAEKKVEVLKKALAQKQAENLRLKQAEAWKTVALKGSEPRSSDEHVQPPAASEVPAVTEVSQEDARQQDPARQHPIQVDDKPAVPDPALAITQSGPAANDKGAPSSFARFKHKLPYYIQLMRLDKPIGILLLLWPTLWALWLAAKGVPSLKNLVIFVLGVLVMRSAGCVINDFADRNIDGRVARTQGRPLATGAVTSREAITLFVGLCLVAFGLVLCTDPLTIKLSVGGLLLAFSYPFMKRHTHLPQVVLGAAFAWGIPMAYAAQKGALDKNLWLIYSAVVLWTVVYDTFYAMVDRDDDLKIGVKSTAILFGEQDRVITGALQLMVLYALVLVGKAYSLGWIYYVSLVVAAGLFSYQQWLIRHRDKPLCFKAFLNNNWVGAAVFAGIALDLAGK